MKRGAALLLAVLAACDGGALIPPGGDGGAPDAAILEPDLATGGAGDAGGARDAGVRTPDLVRARDLASDLASAPPDLVPFVPGQLQPGDTTLSLTVAGKARSVLLHVPAAVTGGALPLVIALHGNGDSNRNFVAALGLAARADAGPFVLAAPQGIRQTFTVGGQTVSGVDWDAYRSAAAGNIDLPLLDAVREQLVATGSIDARRVVLFGYSQGGYLAFRGGLEAAARLSCTAVAAAANPLPGSPLIAQAARKIPVALQIGTGDGALGAARATRDELMTRGHPLQYQEIQGAGHVPFPGNPAVPLDYCRSQQLP